MKIVVTKNIDVLDLLNQWQDMFSDEERCWEFNSHDWELVTNTMACLQKYYNKYGDIDNDNGVDKIK